MSAILSIFSDKRKLAIGAVAVCFIGFLVLMGTGTIALDVFEPEETEVPETPEDPETGLEIKSIPIMFNFSNYELVWTNGTNAEDQLSLQNVGLNEFTYLISDCDNMTALMLGLRLEDYVGEARVGLPNDDDTFPEEKQFNITFWEGMFNALSDCQITDVDSASNFELGLDLVIYPDEEGVLPTFINFNDYDSIDVKIGTITIEPPDWSTFESWHWGNLDVVASVDIAGVNYQFDCSIVYND